MSATFPLSRFEDGTATRVDIDGVPVAVVRIKERVLAIADTCSHAAVSLSDGEVWCDELQLECPRHGSLFSLVTGKAETLPATQPVEVFGVVIQGDNVIISRVSS